MQIKYFLILGVLINEAYAYKEANLAIFFGSYFVVLLGIAIYIFSIVRKPYRKPENSSINAAQISLDTQG
ncbi:unnamed protein product [Blepharisma stoltei]|uniref:Uncharacterized protein n=1 Tax=Blepharisma stoltei TaxID=1481888 RepID=A0AAU9JVW3_9CILI|nr:unnamed protein product [Blepharisma stoltei]